MIIISKRIPTVTDRDANYDDEITVEPGLTDDDGESGKEVQSNTERCDRIVSRDIRPSRDYGNR